MRRYFWFILFLSVLLFYACLEQAYILIYYTMWTFLLETMYFGLTIAGVDTSHLYETIFAPTIVVFVGFWMVIAPTYWNSPKPNNAMFVCVTHGFNAIAMVSERKGISPQSVWKPVMYTIVYNLFLVVYVGAGGRSISGKLPYWYARYDEWVGWAFFFIAVAAVTAVHMVAAIYVWPVQTRTKDAKQYIV